MLSRRDFVLATASAIGAAALPGIAGAQTAAPTAAFHRFAVGAIPVTVLNDGVVRRPDVTKGFVMNAPTEAVAAALTAAGVQGPSLDNPFNPTVVQTRAGLVLIDTGFGPEGLPNGTGKAADAMRAAGLDPAAVTMVIFTHFHGDHIGGLLGPDGALFPNAAIKVPEAEWAFWTDEGEAARASEARRPAFANVKRRFAPYAARVERFAPGAEVAPGIHAVATNGHSPGHTSFLVADGGAQCLIIGDAISTPALFMANPEWYPSVDMDPTKSVATRLALLNRIASEKMPVVGYHFPVPATGRIERAGTGYRLLPANA